MTLIALETGADVTVVIFMQISRLLLTTITFPLLMKRWFSPYISDNRDHVVVVQEGKTITLSEDGKLFAIILEAFNCVHEMLNHWKWSWREIVYNRARILVTCVIGMSEALLFLRLGIPAGALIGSLIFIGTISLLGLKIRQPSNISYMFMHIGLGLMVSDNISTDTIRSISSTVFASLVLSATLTLGSSLCIAHLIKRMVDWDFPTCFLASAPAGLTAMTSIAIDYGMNPLPVIMLHLVRLIALKVCVPLLFFYLM